MSKRAGRWTITLPSKPRFLGYATNVGPEEGKGMLGQYYDSVQTDYMRGLFSAEQAERLYMREACDHALSKANCLPTDMDMFIAGDLLNQIVTANFVARDLQIPFIGVYNACASIGDALTLSGIMIDGNYADKVLISVSSHYQTAERQYRYPIEHNIQRKAANQCTVTGAAAAVLGYGEIGPQITHLTVGQVVDYGLKDPNHMGAAMAPAAADTFLRHMADLGATPADYDLILTGDLAAYGKTLFTHLIRQAGFSLGNKYQDAATLIYSQQQQVNAGGSGAACLAVVLFGYIFKEMAKGRWRRVLALATGALFSPISYKQGESIPCVAHAIVIEQQ